MHDALVTRPLLFLLDVEGLVSIADNRSRRGRPETEWARPAQFHSRLRVFAHGLRLLLIEALPTLTG